MANTLILDRTYTYDCKHYGPGTVEFGEDEQEAFDAVSKRHAEIVADESGRELQPPSPTILPAELHFDADDWQGIDFAGDVGRQHSVLRTDPQ